MRVVCNQLMLQAQIVTLTNRKSMRRVVLAAPSHDLALRSVDDRGYTEQLTGVT